MDVAFEHTRRLYYLVEECKLGSRKQIAMPVGKVRRRGGNLQRGVCTNRQQLPYLLRAEMKEGVVQVVFFTTSLVCQKHQQHCIFAKTSA